MMILSDDPEHHQLPEKLVKVQKEQVGKMKIQKEIREVIKRNMLVKGKKEKPQQVNGLKLIEKKE